jgi:hypothetical protein
MYRSIIQVPLYTVHSSGTPHVAIHRTSWTNAYFICHCSLCAQLHIIMELKILLDMLTVAQLTKKTPPLLEFQLLLLC